MRPAGQIAVPMERAGPVPVRSAAAPASSEVRVHTHVATAVETPLWGEWESLVAEAAEVNCFAEPWFIDASLRTIRRDREIRLLEVRRGAGLIGVLPIAPEVLYGRLPVIFTQNWCHHQMFLGTPLVRAGEETAFWTAVIETLDSAEWAWSFLHVHGLVEDGPVHRGLQSAAAKLGRSSPIVHRRLRAFLQSDLGPDAYYEAAVRQKKRKEIRRLRNRLAELGALSFRILDAENQIENWCDSYLAMEKAGWKGERGTALACQPHTEAYFREVVRAAWEAGWLQFLRLDLDERPLAMLVNLISPPGSFSFKTSFDEEFARFSPGVLLQIENLRILERGDIDWMDSCARDDHPMIDSLWMERRSVVRVTVPLKGARRRLVHGACRAVEFAASAARSLRKTST
jgi:CelD/BcsL family acetyltransferase involved in cellulose biosynthesis